MVDGQAGTDTGNFNGFRAVTVNLTTGTATGRGSDLLFNIENVFGSNLNDTITGNGATTH
jgi:hypothetical protein